MAQSAAIAEARAAIERLRPWRRGSEQAPHKPLLLLLALRRVQINEPRLVDFNSIEGPLSELIQQFSPRRSHIHPEYPFWRLQHDGLWEVLDAPTFSSRKSNTDPPVSELRSRPAIGGFPAQLDAALRTQPKVVAELALMVLGRFIAAEDRNRVVEAVGLVLDDQPQGGC